jgi:hypothetical protein
MLTHSLGGRRALHITSSNRANLMRVTPRRDWLRETFVKDSATNTTRSKLLQTAYSCRSTGMGRRTSPALGKGTFKSQCACSCKTCLCESRQCRTSLARHLFTLLNRSIHGHAAAWELDHDGPNHARNRPKGTPKERRRRELPESG